MDTDLKVTIGRSHSDSNRSVISISEITNPLWDNVSGGYHEHHSGYSLYGYIDYALAMELVGCSGTHEYFGNQAKIFIVKPKNKQDPCYEGYQELARLAGEKPSSYTTAKTPCTKRILQILEKGPLTRGVLRDILLRENYPSNRVRNAINSLKRDNRIICEGSPFSKSQILKIF
jgi:hypothetical protein